MQKDEALDFLEGRINAATAIGCRPQAISKWPKVLPDRIADRVIAAGVRLGKKIPAKFLSRPNGRVQQS